MTEIEKQFDEWLIDHVYDPREPECIERMKKDCSYVVDVNEIKTWIRKYLEKPT